MSLNQNSSSSKWQKHNSNFLSKKGIAAHVIEKSKSSGPQAWVDPGAYFPHGSHFPFLNQLLWPEGEGPELHVLPRELMVGAVPLKPQTLREEQFPKELLLEEVRTDVEWVKTPECPTAWASCSQSS